MFQQRSDGDGWYSSSAVAPFGGRPLAQKHAPGFPERGFWSASRSGRSLVTLAAVCLGTSGAWLFGLVLPDHDLISRGLRVGAFGNQFEIRLHMLDRFCVESQLRCDERGVEATLRPGRI